MLLTKKKIYKKKHKKTPKKRNKQNGGSLEELNKNCTILIKTFMRPNCITVLIKSIRKYYKKIPIIVIDDNKIPLHPNEWSKDNIIWYTLPENSGNSFGRNYGLSKIKTKYFFYFDDDYLVDNRTDLALMYDLIIKSKFDIISGNVDDNGRYLGNFYIENDTVLLNTNYNHIFVDNIKITLSNRVVNFYIANTESVKKTLGWCNRIKSEEHTLFFFEIFINFPNFKIGSIKESTIKNRGNFPYYSECIDKRYKQFRWESYTQQIASYVKNKYNLKFENNKLRH